MTNPLATLEADLVSLCAEWAGAIAFGSVEPTRAEPDSPLVPSAAEPAALSDAGLVRVLDVAARLRRSADAMLARLSAEVDARSDSGFGADGLAKQHGYRNAAQLIAATTGGSAAEAGRFLRVGAAIRPRSSFTGGVLPSRHPFVADALGGGQLSLEAADAICGMLERIAPRTSPRRSEAYETELVRFAIGAPHALVTRAVRHAEARLDPDGVEPRDEVLREQRTLTITEEASGFVRITARLDPASAAPVKAVIEAIVTEALHRRADAAVSDGSVRADLTARPGHIDPTDSADRSTCGPVIEDRRTIVQLQADALADLARHALGCREAPTAAKATVVVRLDLDALLEGLGQATVDGLDRPISAAAARRLAVDAELIPAVLGGDRLPLDLGRGRRLFSRAQRLALAERDGGCASCGRNVAYVDAHHIEWWHRHRGRTDLENGVLLCSNCHHQVHREGWRIRADRRSVWFIPPPHVDPEQRPRLGGRARFELDATSAEAGRVEAGGVEAGGVAA